jgi:hypothetical protein
MSEKYVELTLSDETVVRCAPVPPLAVPEVVAAQPDCKMPPAPMEEVETKVGSEKAPAKKGSGAYEAWRAEVQEVHRRRAETERIAHFVLGVIAWKLPDKKNFSSKVPNGWSIPERFTAMGIQPSESDLGHRGDFIKYELIKTTDDLLKVNQVVFSTKPVTESEVEASADLFRGDEEGRADTGGEGAE